MKKGIKIAESPITTTTSCCRLQYHFGRWYFLLVYEDEIEPNTMTQNICALDGGIRTFQTYYSENEAGEIGFDMNPKIDKINKRIENISNKIKDPASVKKRNRLKRAWYRSYSRASNLVDDLHNKTIKFLLDKYDVIIAPRLNVLSLLNNESVLSVSTKKRLSFLCHGRFTNKLKRKANSIIGKKILDMEEHGTSKTCSQCGSINHDLHDSKTFECTFCDLRMDRDINAAKNHILKGLFGNDNY